MPTKKGDGLIYKTPKELELKIEEFFKLKEKDKLIPAVEMLAVHLGITRVTILSYQNRNDKYEKIIIAAKEKITGMKVESMLNGKGSTIGIIFDLKNNAGFTDKQEIKQETTLNGSIDLTTMSDDELDNMLTEIK